MKHYLRAEDEMILHYIVFENAYNRVGGIQLWKDMELEKVGQGEGRT